MALHGWQVRQVAAAYRSRVAGTACPAHSRQYHSCTRVFKNLQWCGGTCRAMVRNLPELPAEVIGQCELAGRSRRRAVRSAGEMAPADWWPPLQMPSVVMLDG